MKSFIIFLITTTAAFTNLNICSATEPNEQDIQLAAEKMQQLKQAYKEYETAVDNFLQVNREATKKNPYLADVETALLMLADMESTSLPGEEKYRQYLAKNKDQNKVRQHFMTCRTYFGPKVFTELVQEAVWDDGLKPGYIKMSRVVFGESGSEDQKEFRKALKEHGISEFDFADSNDERLWNNIKKFQFELNEFHNSFRGKYIIDNNIPEYVAEYAGYYDFENGSSEMSSLWLKANTPKEVIEAAIQLTRKGRVLPGIDKINQLLTDKILLLTRNL